ncbi:MAG: hypothetical protein IKN11_05840 [Bacteroidales bacterium]|nr:hypothetical protein [Bacteroidales bacterium]
MAQIKRKVSLRQKTTGNEVTAAPLTPTKPKKPWWPWLLVGVLVCGVIIFLMTRGKGDANDILEQSTEQIEEDVPAQDVPNVAEPESKENGTGESTDEQSTVQNETLTPEPSQKASDMNTSPQQNQGSPANKQQATPKTQVPQSTVQNNASASRSMTMSEANGTIEEEAWRTIRGNYGNGAARKKALGSRYEEIQAKVNDYYREGKVY